MEQFFTIQGEGYHQGKAAYFIRLAGCDVGCVWCDVKDSWDATKHPSYSLADMVQKVTDSKAKIAVITGGEPLMHDLDALTTSLQEHGIATNIETSGSSPMSGYWDWICLSPKKFKAPLPEVIAAAHELKIIIFNKSDFAWAEQFAAKVPNTCKLYLQPEWEKRHEMMPLIVDYVLQHQRWEISIQMHKYIGVE